MINHACFPNCVKLTFGDSASFVFSTQKICKDAEVFVNYLGNDYSYLYRATFIQEQHWFDVDKIDEHLVPKEFAKEVMDLELLLDMGTHDPLEIWRKLEVLVPQHPCTARVRKILMSLFLKKKKIRRLNIEKGSE